MVTGPYSIEKVQTWYHSIGIIFNLCHVHFGVELTTFVLRKKATLYKMLEMKTEIFQKSYFSNADASHQGMIRTCHIVVS